MHVEASETGCGAFLASQSKGDDNSFDIIAYYGHRFQHGQRNYSGSMKECCGEVHCALAPVLVWETLTVVIDHQALTYI